MWRYVWKCWIQNKIQNYKADESSIQIKLKIEKNNQKVESKWESSKYLKITCVMPEKPISILIFQIKCNVIK